MCAIEYKALSEADSVWNSDVSSEEDSERNLEDDNAAAAVSHDYLFSCVSDVISPCPISFLSLFLFPLTFLWPKFLIFFSFATTKLARKRARKARINLARKQQIASYLSLDTKHVSRKTHTSPRVHFGFSNLVDSHATQTSQSVLSGFQCILCDSYSYVSSAKPVSDVQCKLPFMSCSNQSSDINLIQAGTPLALTSPIYTKALS